MKSILVRAITFIFSLSICYTAKAQNASFEITYNGFTAEAETAFEYATEIWSKFLISDVPIKISAHLQPLLPGQLGITFPNGELNFAGAPVNDVWYASCLANAISGVDLSPDEVDMDIYLNSLASWYFGTDGNPGAAQYDFVSTALHEICHGLGFLSLGNKDGTSGSFGIIPASAFAPLVTSFPWPELDTLPSVFDSYLENAAGTKLRDIENPSDVLGTSFITNLVYFNSPIVLEDNTGERGRIYAPGTFTLGSSLSHWEEGAYPVGDPNELMTPMAAPATSNYKPGPLTLAVLDEIGWEIIYDTATIAVQNLKREEIYFYPNPVNDILFVRSNTNYERAEIFNAEGKLILIKDLHGGESEIQFDNFPAGYYLIKLIGDKNIITNKLLKE